MESRKYEESATFFCVAVEYNERITSNLENKMKGMDQEFLLASRRKCLKLWNQFVIRRFSTNNEQVVAANNMLPIMELMDLSIGSQNHQKK